MTPQIVPPPGSPPNIIRDALQSYKVLKAGGVILAPTDAGYALLTSTQAGIQRIFASKNRRQDHNIGVIGTYHQHRQLHILPESKFEMTRVLTEDMGMIVGLVAILTLKT